MRRDGFTLVELMVVIAVMGVLIALAAPNWNNMQKKGAVEREIKTLYADLMEARLQALYTKRSRSVVVSGAGFSVYSSVLTSVLPLSSKALRYPLKWNSADTPLTLTFDADGLYLDQDAALCVIPEGDLAADNPGAVDSIVVSAARIKLGKRKSGGACDPTADPGIVQN